MSTAVLDITVNVAEQEAFFRAVRDRITNRGPLHEKIAVRCEVATREYLVALNLEGSSHKTAQRLGAEPTGYFGKASDAVTHRSSAEAAIVAVAYPGISRAFRDVTIVPVNKQWLTIPMHAAAYGRRAGTLARLLGVKFFRPYKRSLLEGPLRPGEKRGRIKGVAHGTRANVLAARQTDNGVSHGILTFWGSCRSF